MACHETIHIRTYSGGSVVIGRCDCGIKTGELVYLLAVQRDPTIEAAKVILKLLHTEQRNA